MTKPFIATSTHHVGIKYQLTIEDNLNAKFTVLSKQVEILALAKATTNFTKDTSTMCALCDTLDHGTDVRLIVTG